MPPSHRPPEAQLDLLVASRGRSDRLTHTEHLPARQGRHAPWPESIRPEIRAAALDLGIRRPWTHQVEAMNLAKAGQTVVIATGTASGKSLGYLAPVLSELLTGTEAPNGRGSTALYLAPTKALAADQRRRATELAPERVRAALYDGDTPPQEREWVRQYASYVLTNPDMLHRSILPAHPRWSSFLKTLRYVVVDECHSYRGVFGSHVAQVLRRLRRVCRRYGADPAFLLASATTADPAATAERLTGLPAHAVTEDASPRGQMVFALWEPPLTEHVGEQGAPVRRTATAEAAYLLTDLVTAGTRTVAFVRSRRAAELVALQAQDNLEPQLANRVAAYRGGYLPEERRALERDLYSGRLLGLASTSALELGIDVSGLDAVLLAGYPGTRASLWQQAGRAGREAQGALAVLIARDDPLDTYLVHHPEALFARPVEATVLDPDNPHVLAPTCAPPPPNCPSPTRTSNCSAQTPPHCCRYWNGEGCCVAGRTAPGTGPDGNARPMPSICGAPAGHRCRSSRSPPGGCWAPWTPMPRTPPCTPAPSTSTRAAATWCASWTWSTRSPWSPLPTPPTPPPPGTSPPSPSCPPSRPWRGARAP